MFTAIDQQQKLPFTLLFDRKTRQDSLLLCRRKLEVLEALPQLSK